MTYRFGGPPREVETPSPIPGYFADPDLVCVDDHYVLAVTTDGHADWGATGFHLFTSTDLVGWVDLGIVFDVRDTSWATGRAWAPAYLPHRGKHYLFFTADGGSIGVAVAEDIRGPYIDSGRPLVPEGAFEGIAIDPSVFVDDGGSVILYWGNAVAHGVRLDDDLTGFPVDAVVSWTPELFREAISVHRRGDIFYASWSVDDTRSHDYRVHYASGPTPFGPWTDQGTLVQKVPERGIVATGHHSVARLPSTDEWVIAYHRFAIPDGDGFHREVRFDRLTHLDDGLIASVAPSHAPLRLPLPRTPGHQQPRIPPRVEGGERQ